MRIGHLIHIRPIRVLFLGLALALNGGCGGQKTYPVQGRVVFKDGTPMAGGMVVFEPVDPATRVSARGEIESDGTFFLSTFGKDDGAVLGKHRVLISPPLPSNFKESRAPARVIHPRYESFETSKLERTVTSGKNDFEIVIEKP